MTRYTLQFPFPTQNSEMHVSRNCWCCSSWFHLFHHYPLLVFIICNYLSVNKFHFITILPLFLVSVPLYLHHLSISHTLPFLQFVVEYSIQTDNTFDTKSIQGVPQLKIKKNISIVSSAVAAQLYSYQQTTPSIFWIPIPFDESNSSDVPAKIQLATVL